MVVLGSPKSDAEAAGSRARTREDLGGGVRRLKFGALWRPSSPVCAWSVESIPMGLDRAGVERARYATRL